MLNWGFHPVLILAAELVWSMEVLVQPLQVGPCPHVALHSAVHVYQFTGARLCAKAKTSMATSVVRSRPHFYAALLQVNLSVNVITIQ